MDDQNHFSEKMTDKNKKVLFDTKIPLHKTTFHQIKKDITSFVSDNSNEMIADIGCPNSVIGLKDVSNFKRGLSNFQLPPGQLQHLAIHSNSSNTTNQGWW